MSAFNFTNAAGASRYGRYRLLPLAGNDYMSDAEAAARGPNCLFDEIRERIAKEPVGLRIVGQLAEDGDPTDDATIRWPEDRPQLASGRSASTRSRRTMRESSNRSSSTRFRASMGSRRRPIRSSSRGQTSI